MTSNIVLTIYLITILASCCHAKSDTSKTGNELDTSKSSVTTDENITTEIENSTSTKTTTVQPVQSDAKNHNSKQKLCLTLKANIAFNVTYIKTDNTTVSEPYQINVTDPEKMCRSDGSYVWGGKQAVIVYFNMSDNQYVLWSIDLFVDVNHTFVEAKDDHKHLHLRYASEPSNMELRTTVDKPYLNISQVTYEFKDVQSAKNKTLPVTISNMLLEVSHNDTMVPEKISSEGKDNSVAKATTTANSPNNNGYVVIICTTCSIAVIVLILAGYFVCRRRMQARAVLNTCTFQK